MGICWIIKQLSCSILRNIPWFSQLGLRPRRLSIRWYSARFRRIIVKYRTLQYNSKFWRAPIGRNRSRDAIVSLLSGRLSERRCPFLAIFAQNSAFYNKNNRVLLSQALCVIGSLGNEEGDHNHNYFIVISKQTWPYCYNTFNHTFIIHNTFNALSTIILSSFSPSELSLNARLLYFR